MEELYQQVIIDHYKAPRNHRRIEDASCYAHGNNPLCGDEVTVYVQLDGDTIKDVSFEGNGCAISKASASLMTEGLLGRSVEEAQTLFTRFHDLVTDQDASPAGVEGLGKLGALAGVRRFPARVKCATLAWHTLRAALDRVETEVTTEEPA